MRTPPPLAVVIAAFNAEPWLDEAIRSIRNQTFTDFELLVVDDGSTDQTAALLHAHADDDPRIQVVTQKNAGVSKARNRALALTRAALIACMDADDIAYPQRLARQIAYLNEHPGVGLLATGCHLLHPDGRRDPPHPSEIELWAAGHNAIADRLAGGRNCLTHSTATFRRAAFDAAGGRYDPRLEVAHDFDLWLRLSEVTSLAVLPEPLLDYRVHPAGLSARRGPVSILDVERAVRGHWRRVGAPAPHHRIDLYQELVRVARSVDSPRTVRALGRRMFFPALSNRDARACARAFRREPLE